MQSCTSGRAGGLVCEPLKAVWPAYAGSKIEILLLLPVPRRERSEVRVQNRSPLILAFSRKREKEQLPDKMTPANVKLYESPSRAGVYLRLIIHGPMEKLA